MCYHVSQEKTIDQLKFSFGRDVNNRDLYRQAFHVNAFDDPYQPVISNKNPEIIDMYKWRLIPTEKDPKFFKANTRNARSEEIFTTPSYAPYWANRCLIICTGFFEPHLVDPAKPTHSYYIKPKSKDFICLGAIYSPWRGVNTYAVLTTEATPLLAEIHNEGKRMPLVLDGEKADQWLRPPKKVSKEEMMQLMAPYQKDEEWVSYRTIDGVTNSKKNTNLPDVLQPYEPPKLSYEDFPLFRN